MAEVYMPIRAHPYEHQRRAFEFALRVFGVLQEEKPKLFVTLQRLFTENLQSSFLDSVDFPVKTSIINSDRTPLHLSLSEVSQGRHFLRTVNREM